MELCQYLILSVAILSGSCSLGFGLLGFVRIGEFVRLARVVAFCCCFLLGLCLSTTTPGIQSADILSVGVVCLLSPMFCLV